jgi:hypothetical protein
MLWISLRLQLPPLWKWVHVRAHSQEDFYYTAYRTIFGRWKFKSGFSGKMDQHNVWRDIHTYSKKQG